MTTMSTRYTCDAPCVLAWVRSHPCRRVPRGVGVRPGGARNGPGAVPGAARSRAPHVSVAGQDAIPVAGHCDAGHRRLHCSFPAPLLTANGPTVCANLGAIHPNGAGPPHRYYDISSTCLAIPPNDTGRQETEPFSMRLKSTLTQNGTWMRNGT
jgi:hypothetical protein